MSVAEIKELLAALTVAQTEYDAALKTWPGQGQIEALERELLAQTRARSQWVQPQADLVNALRAQIEDRVLALGETVKSDALMAVWTKPRVSWDGKLLEGFATAHPEILPFRHIGQPSVSIRPVRRDADA